MDVLQYVMAAAREPMTWYGLTTLSVAIFSYLTLRDLYAR